MLRNSREVTAVAYKHRNQLDNPAAATLLPVRNFPGMYIPGNYLYISL